MRVGRREKGDWLTHLDLPFSDTYWEKFPLLMHTKGAFLDALDLESALTK